MRRVADLSERITRLERFESWRPPTKLNIPELVGEELWSEYRANWRQLLESMRASQELAVKVRARLQESTLSSAPARHSRAAVTPRQAPVPDADERSLVIQRLRDWATRPHLNVHRIIGIVVRAGGHISRDQLVKETARVTGSRNAYGAIASLLTTSGNAYGRVFQDDGGMIRIHPEVESTVRSLRWS